MSTIYILIPIAVFFVFIAVYLFFWAVKTDQFEDLEKQGMSILFGDEQEKKKKAENELPDNHDDSNSDASNGKSE